MSIVTDFAKEKNWFAYKNGNNQYTISFVDTDEDPFDLTNYTFSVLIRRLNGSTTLLTLSQESGITNGTTTGVLTIQLTENQASVILPRDLYYWEIRYVFGGQTYRMYYGKLYLQDEENDGTPATDSQSLSLAGTAVTATVTLAGEGGGGDVTQEELDAAIAAEAVARTAGDNPYDIIEVAGDISTYTVLLAHKNCILNFRSNTDFTVLLSSVIAVEDFFCYIKMKGIGKPTLLADTGYTLEAVSPTIYTQEGGATVYYEGNNVFSAEGALGQVSLETLETIASTGTVISFDLSRRYGSSASPITGNITINSVGMIEGITQKLIHNDDQEPVWPSEVKKVIGNYIADVNNYCYLHVVEKSPVLIQLSIVQIPS